MKTILVALCFLCGCNWSEAMSSKPPASNPGSTTPISGKSLFPKQEWTDTALAAVVASKLASAHPADEKTFCPQGMNTWNWVHLLASMAKFESGFDPNQVYKESFGVNSIGLLQLSVSDKAYGCAFATESDVKDPTKNINCAVKILEKWVLQDGVISNSANKGGARYWSTLRQSGKLSSVKASMKSWCSQ